MNPKFVILFLSISVISIISSVFGLGIMFMFNNETHSKLSLFIGTFLSVTALQFIIYSLYDLKIRKNHEYSLNKIAVQQVKKEIIQLSCAACRKQCLVPIDINEENVFECPECKTSNVVVVQFTVARRTTPKIARMDLLIPENMQDLPIDDKDIKDIAERDLNVEYKTRKDMPPLKSDVV